MALPELSKSRLFTCDKFRQPVPVFEATNYTKKHEFVFNDNSISEGATKFQAFCKEFGAQKNQKTGWKID